MVNIEAPGPEIDEREIEEFEAQISHGLPEQYREFMLRNNGGEPNPDTFDFPNGKTGSTVQFFHPLEDEGTDRLQFVVKQMQGRVPSDLLPIATCVVGNLVCIGLDGERRGKLYYWDHELESREHEPPGYDNITFLSDSFDEFLDGLYKSSLPED